MSHEMPFLHHCIELRSKLGRAVIGIVIFSITCFTYSELIFDFLVAPFVASFEGYELIGTSPAEAFMVKLKVSFLAGVLFSLPLTFYQTWKFIEPALHEHERKHAIPFIVSSTLLFSLGVSFCFYGVLPYAFDFFQAEYESLKIAPAIKISEYVSFCVKLLLVFGLAFEFPLGSYFLTRLKLITYGFLLRNFGYAVLVMFLFAAIVTPPDVITQFMLAGPLIVLYGVCILIAYFFEPKPLI